jgi:hypothetical protein
VFILDKNISELTERTTIYLNETIKTEAKIKLLKENQYNYETKSFSALINELLIEYINKDTKL